MRTWAQQHQGSVCRMWKCFNLAKNQIFPMISLPFHCISEASTCAMNLVGHLWWLCDNKMLKMLLLPTKLLSAFLKSYIKAAQCFPFWNPVLTWLLWFYEHRKWLTMSYNYAPLLIQEGQVRIPQSTHDVLSFVHLSVIHREIKKKEEKNKTQKIKHCPRPHCL